MISEVLISGVQSFAPGGAPGGERGPAHHGPGQLRRERGELGKGQMGVGTNGITANYFFF